MTLLGAQRLREADVVLYDALVNPALLSHTRPEAGQLPVGKRAGRPMMAQPEINALMIRLAREGKRVVRLKGGDPFVFGRGAEEAAALKAAGVPFEVVPGVTAGIAGPAYAGIPATDREFASTVTFVAGREDEDKPEPSVPWEALAKLEGTLVFYMGVKRIGWIADNLMSAGMDRATAGCVIESATLPGQRTIVGSLATLADAAGRAGVQPPGIVVVGRVVLRRDEIGWRVEGSGAAK
jgi:uroporphyrinogen III methyltransferase/synthase